MKKFNLYIVVALIILIPVVLAGCGQKTVYAPADTGEVQPAAEVLTEDTGAATTSVIAVAQKPKTKTISVPKTISINIKNFTFTTKSITIKAGTTVKWTNNDSVAHTVTSDTGAFNSSSLETGKSFSFTFNKKGTFAYHCTPHPSMTAAIIVK